MGSTSLTTDANGLVVSELRYTAWGETRYSAGSTATKYQYTGQYSYTADFGLHFYNARWYDSSLGRFAQPDTIIPPAQGVQGWDRYAYTNNNPIRYTDPSGHKACSLDENGDCDDTEEKIINFLDHIETVLLNENSGELKKKHKNDVLGAMNIVVRKAAYEFGDDWNTFLDTTTYVFTGYYGHGSETMAKAGFPGFFTDGFDGYFDGSLGFHPDFVDESNQVRHFWAAFATAVDPYGNNPAGEAMAHIGNIEHDLLEDWLGFKDTTVMDYKLSLTGIDIARQVGPEKETRTPGALAAVLLYRLGINGPGYIGGPIDSGLWRSPFQ